MISNIAQNFQNKKMKNCPWYYEQQSLGFNYRLPDINASLGLSQLRRLHIFIKQRQQVFDTYKSLFSSLPVRFLSVPPHILSSLHLAVMQLTFNDPSFHKHLFNTLRSSNIGVQLHYYPVHLQPFYRGLGFKPGDFPIAELYASISISLPIFPDISADQQSKVFDVVSSQF